MKSFDLDRARRETPGCANVAHFNNAGAALMPRPVLESVANHLLLESLIGGYEAKAKEIDKVERVYDSLSALLNCHRDEVAIIENATRAWDMAFYSVPLGPGDRILTAVAEYASNYISYLQVARRTGAVIEVVPDDGRGQLSVDALRDLIDDRVKLIAITHVPTNNGLVNPALEVGKVAREAGVLYLLDACQSVGQMPLDVREIGCDMLSGTGRKYLRGPRGTGFLYVRRERIKELEPPFLDLHAAELIGRDEFRIRADARRFENWETNFAGKIGLGVAVDYAMEWGLDLIRDRVNYLADLLRARLGDIPRVTVRDRGAEKCGIVCFTVEGKSSDEIRRSLSEWGINVWVAQQRDTRLDGDGSSLPDMVRASVHYYNTEEEVARLCETLARLL
ncbi:MAG TPA: aminotransferase class V-fold PLP-dependent enzyme [Blastocatellia bacterium]|nr:aminotransferase class V-fold PLP-dependent enzyme [Blastocatellia bacterium]